MIYLCQAKGEPGSPIKIGCSKNPAGRLKALQIANWQELVLIATFPGNSGTERELHAQLAKHRIRGEWFAAHPDVLAIIDDPPAVTYDDSPIAPWQGPVYQSWRTLPPTEPVPDLVLRRRGHHRYIVQLPPLFIILKLRRDRPNWRPYTWQRAGHDASA